MLGHGAQRTQQLNGLKRKKYRNQAKLRAAEEIRKYDEKKKKFHSWQGQDIKC